MIFVREVPRLARKKSIEWLYRPTRYRTALGILLNESEGRCAYSLEHVDDVGRKLIEVDHFDPTLKHPERNRHGNLLPATRHVNGSKGQYWPSAADLKMGLYIINPYAEADYGTHIIEVPATGELRGLTPTGRWHIERLDLNADHLVLKRLDRTKFIQAIKQTAFSTGSDPSGKQFKTLVAALKEFEKSYLTKTIPPLPTKKL